MRSGLAQQLCVKRTHSRRGYITITKIIIAIYHFYGTLIKVGITNLWVMWMDEWVKFPGCTKLLSLRNNAKNFSPSSKIKMCTLYKTPPPVWPHHQHMHTQKEYLNIWICPGTTSIPVYRPKLTFQMAVLASNDRSQMKPTITEPSFRKLNSPPTKVGRCFTHTSN